MTSSQISPPLTVAGRRVEFAETEITPQAQLAALRVLRGGWVTTGPETVGFERDLAAYLDAPHVVAVASCTAAIELCLRALRLPAGAPVLTPSLTFCGAVSAILHAGLRPVLVDIDDRTLVPTAATVAAAARRADPPAAMVVQHQAGYPVRVGELAAAAGLPMDRIVEDAAHGLGATLDGRPVGHGHAGAACLSFYATKNLPIGEGGAITTSNELLARTVATTRLHGMSRDAWRRYLPGGSWRYAVECGGLKANLTDVSAAIGRAQLRHLPRWQVRRAELAARYDIGLAGLAGILRPVRPTAGTHAWHLYQVRVLPPYPLTRDELVEQLGRRGIGASVHFIPVHQLGYFRTALGAIESAAVPVTDRVFPSLLSLPMHPGLDVDSVDVVCQAISELAGASTGTRWHRL